MTPQGHELLEAPDDDFDRSGAGDRRLPRIEVITHSERAPTAPVPRRGLRSLLLWFLGAFALIFIPASIWNFSRPPVYRAAAAVLTVVPEVRSGFGSNDPDLQHVAIQRQLLLGRELLSDTLARVRDTPRAPDLLDPPLLTPDDLRPLLSVDPIPSTNLVEMSASGGKPELLAVIVNEWLAAYEAVRQQEITRQVGTQLQQLGGKAQSLEDKISDQRAALDAFRQRHDIVTLERDSNQALKRLATLQDSLAKAEEESIQARAQLQALQAALANGETVMPKDQAAALNSLEEKAAELRVQVDQQAKRYTDMFIQNDPDKRALPEMLAQIEARIEEMTRQGLRDVINEARQAVDSTTGRVLTLQRELRTQKVTAARFSASFAEYEELQSDLAALETMQRETEGERAALESEAVNDYPQIEVIEPAYAPRDPLRPLYLRDLGYSTLGAVAAGLATVLTLLFLDAKANQRPGSAPVTGVRIWGEDRAAESEREPERDWSHRLDRDRDARRPLPRDQAPNRLAAPGAGAPPDTPLRQLTGGEIEALWDLAGDHERQLLGLLLSGLRPEELGDLGEGNFDLQRCRIQVQGTGARTVGLAPGLCRLFAAAEPLPAWIDDPDRRLDELADRIPLLALDAGIAHAHEVNVDVLRHSYLVYLVRQGARLTELHRIAGPMTAAETRRYARFSAAGASRPLDQLNLVYPVLA